jgi:hypothetical protein
MKCPKCDWPMRLHCPVTRWCGWLWCFACNTLHNPKTGVTLTPPYNEEGS